MSTITYHLTKTDKELEEIIELQQKNLPNHLPNSEKQKEGFVTVVHTLPLLKKMQSIYPHIIAKNNQKVVAYALSMDKALQDTIPVLKPMFKEIASVFFEDYIVMGQICIAKEYRGKGIFRGLYKYMEETFKGVYKAIITEIDATNTRSLQAHKAVGFTVIKRYQSNNQNWVVVKLVI